MSYWVSVYQGGSGEQTLDVEHRSMEAALAAFQQAMVANAGKLDSLIHLGRVGGRVLANKTSGTDHAVILADAYKVLAAELAAKAERKADKTPREITVSYEESVDGYGRVTRKKFTRLGAARQCAQDRLGKHPEIGCGWAVSVDGVGKVSAAGATLAELFPSPVGEG